jgi:hypothetical protein
MSRSDFVREYMGVRRDAFKERTVLQAWKKSGAWPINPNVFTDDDFAPSVPYSTQVRDLPATFPSSKTAEPPASADEPDASSDNESDDSDDSDSDSDDDMDNEAD